MHKNPDYSKLFRGRPLRFVLPMKQPTSDIPTEHNLVRVRTVNQSLEIFENLEAPGDFEKTDFPDDRHTKPWKNPDNYKFPDKDNVLARRATAHRLPDGNVFVKPELLCDLGCETPRLNYDSYLGREYRYFYAISSDVDIDNPGTLIKVDTVTKTKKIWHEKGLYPSEPIFVPDPDGKVNFPLF